jgi:MinD-like ATPase involved in chromosome partitioning or flagellar assembly
MSRHSWADLLPAGDTPSREQIESVMLTHQPSGLAVLPAPQMPQRDSLSELACTHVLRTLAESYSAIVVDVSSLGPAAMVALFSARTVVVPMSDDVLSVQTTAGVLRMLAAAGVDMDRVQVVLNHVREEGGVPVAAVQKAIKRALTMELAYEPGQLKAVPQGKPLIMMQPKSAFARGILNLVKQV